MSVKFVKVVFIAVVLGVVLTGCGVGDAWKNTDTPLQKVEKAVLTNAVPQFAPQTAASTVAQDLGNAVVNSLRQQPQAAAVEQPAYNAKTIRAFNGSICPESQAEFTGKVYICPASREMCAKNGKSVVVDSMGFAACR